MSKSGKSKPLARRIVEKTSGRLAFGGIRSEHKWCCSLCFQVYAKAGDAQACCAKVKISRELTSAKSSLTATSKPENPPIGILNRMCKQITYYTQEQVEAV